MNGLLHRLAARAAGTAVPVRSDVRWPYGGAALAWTDSAQAEGAVPHEATLPVAAAGQAPLSQARPRQPGRAEPKPLQLSAATAPTAAPEPSAELPLGMTPGTSLRDAQASALDAIPAIAGGPERLERPERRERPTLARVEELAARDAALSVPARTEPPAGPQRSSRAAPFERDPEAAVPVARIRADPAPLLPPAADRSPPAAALAPPVPGAMPAPPQRAAWPAVAASSAADEATEVHIHIGRIDVTAVHEAPTPRRRPASTQAPMSLDSYLAQRRRS